LGLTGLALTGLRDAWTTQLLVAFSYLFIAANATLLYLYTPEIYPTRIRAFGVGIATAWLRIASTVAPLLVPLVLNGYGIRGVVALSGTVALLGAAASLLATETAGIALEELSP
jgi:putative MFS transporter